MSIILADRVKETTTSAGTGDILLDGAAPGFQSFFDGLVGNSDGGLAGISDTYYCISARGTGQWEVGLGFYTSWNLEGTEQIPPQLTRTTVFRNSSGGTDLIDFAAGTKDVFITLPAERAVHMGEPYTITLKGGPGGTYRVGLGPGANTDNAVLGNDALNSNTSGGYNTAIGSNSLVNNTEGDYNTALGESALCSNTTGYDNVGLGEYTAVSLEDGNENIAIGYQSLGASVSDSYNVAVGTSALDNVDGGSNNVGIGYSAGIASALGNYNVIIGSESGGNLDFSSGNTVLGSNLYAPSQIDNQIIIGSGAGTKAYHNGTDWTFTGDVSADSLTIPVANVHISGGTGGYVLTTDGLGALSWAAASAPATDLTGMVTSISGATTVVTNADLTGVITSAGNATSIASQTGTGTKFVVDTSPVLVTPNLGTPSAGVLTNCTFPTLDQDTTGTAAKTNALNSATTVVNVSSATAPTVGQVLTATNGTAATWQTPSGGGATLSNDTTTATQLYPMFAAATSGVPTTVYTSNTKLLYKPSTGELAVKAPVAANGLVVNASTVSSSYTIDTGFNACSVGPITVGAGVAVSIASGQRWVIL